MTDVTIMVSRWQAVLYRLSYIPGIRRLSLRLLAWTLSTEQRRALIIGTMYR